MKQRTYASRLVYMVRNLSPTPSTSSTRNALLQRVRVVPIALNVSDCSSTTALSPTLLKVPENKSALY